MRNFDNFRQAVESPKSLNSMRYICLKSTFLQLKHYIRRICLTLLSTAVKIHPIPYVIFEIISHFSRLIFQLVGDFLAQTSQTVDKNIPSKCTFSDVPLLELKFTKFLMSLFKKKSVFLQSLDHSSVT